MRRTTVAVGDHSLLGAYLNALLSYPDRIFEGVTVCHPRTLELIAHGIPVEGDMPKETELLQIIDAEISKGRKVLVYIQNSNTTDISPRLVRMIEGDGEIKPETETLMREVLQEYKTSSS